MAGLNDTRPEAEQVLRAAYRAMPFAAKLRQMGVLYRTARVLHALGFRQRNPAATEAMIHDDWRQLGGRSCFASSGRRDVGHEEENLAVVQEVATVFAALDVPHAVSGSWASSLFGKPRFTNDADVLVEPFPGKEAAFCAAFGENYYVSQPMVEEAISQRSSFNVIHLASGFKVDVFIRKDRPFEVSVLARRQAYPLPGGQSFTLVSPEDVILLKLEWYRLGGNTSERQWGDVVGVLQIQAGRLDQGYLEQWAADLGVGDLLERARQESGA